MIRQTVPRDRGGYSPGAEIHTAGPIPKPIDDRKDSIEGRYSGIVPLAALADASSLHYDALHALGFVNQIYGDKEFIVFPSERGEVPLPVRTRSRHSDLNDPFEPDRKRFPLFTQALQCRFVLGPGETIFNPAGWWHATRMLTPSVAVVISTVNGRNWDEFSHDMGRDRPGVPWPATSCIAGIFVRGLASPSPPKSACSFSILE